MNIQSILDKITGKHVRFVGLLLAIAAGIFVSVHIGATAGIGFLVSVVLAALNWVFPILGKSKTFTNFADPKYWPTFVLLGIAIEFLVPGLLSKVGVGAILAIFDGMYFTDNPGNY